MPAEPFQVRRGLTEIMHIERDTLTQRVMSPGSIGDPYRGC